MPAWCSPIRWSMVRRVVDMTGEMWTAAAKPSSSRAVRCER